MAGNTVQQQIQLFCVWDLPIPVQETQADQGLDKKAKGQIFISAFLQMTRCRVPSCSRKDKIAHLVFFFSIFITIGCFSLVVCLSNQVGVKLSKYLSLRPPYIQPLPSKPSELSPNLTALEMLSLLGGVFLFLAFFVAIFAEGSADFSLLQVFMTLPLFFPN